MMQQKTQKMETQNNSLDNSLDSNNDASSFRKKIIKEFTTSLLCILPYEGIPSEYKECQVEPDHEIVVEYNKQKKIVSHMIFVSKNTLELEKLLKEFYENIVVKLWRTCWTEKRQHKDFQYFFSHRSFARVLEMVENDIVDCVVNKIKNINRQSKRRILMNLSTNERVKNNTKNFPLNMF